MPGINIGALKTAEDIALAILKAEINEEVSFTFKNGEMTFKRIR